jgi:hypothetical protein
MGMVRILRDGLNELRQLESIKKALTIHALPYQLRKFFLMKLDE